MDLGRQVLKFIKENVPTREDVKGKFGISDSELDEVIQTIRRFDHEILFQEGHFAVNSKFENQKEFIVVKDGNLEPIELYFSDTHFGDKKCNEERIVRVIEEAYARGARVAFHSGDLTTGRTVYKGQLEDLRYFTFEQQLERARLVLPKKEGLRYFMINGNHDFNWLELNAGNPVKTLATMRDDITFIGDGYGRIIKNGIKIDLVHLAGSCTSAASGKVQEYLRKFCEGKSSEDEEALGGTRVEEGGSKKIVIDENQMPDILSAGHLHKMLVMTSYGVECIYPGHFQGANAFTRRMGLRGPQGSYLVDYKIDKRQVTHFRTEKLR